MTLSARWRRYRRSWSAPALIGMVVAATPVQAQVQTPGDTASREGRRVLETLCFACHSIGGGARVGPDLQGVAERRTRPWLSQFIGNPEQLFSAQDSTALALLAQYGVRMPNLGLTPAQVEAVIAELGAGEAAPATRPPLFLPTLALAVLAAAGITLVALTVVTKRVEIRA